MIELVTSKGYCEDLERMPDDIRHKVERLEGDIRYEDISPGARPEKLRDTSIPLWSYRVSDDIRMIVHRWKDREWVLMACGHHDDAYDKARKLRLQAVDGERLPKVVVEEIKRVIVKPVIESVNSREAPSGFIGLSEKDMAAVGVPSEAQAPLLRITTEEGLLSFLEKRVKWSARLKDVLMDLFTDPARLSEFAKEWDEQKNHPPIRSALKDSPTAAEQFVILDDEMRRKFYNGKLEKWQVFLHPSQRRAVEMKETNGPAMVTGAAGTGKTVVAVHRAKWLLENRFRNGERILFTTYVTTLVDSVKSMLRTICTPEQLSRIDVINLDSILRKEWGRFRPGGQIVYDDNKLTLSMLDNLLAKDPSLYSGRRTNEFLAKEYEKVVLEFDIHSLDEYRRVERPGILGRVDREKERAVLWPVFAALNKMSLADASGDINRAAALNQLANAMSGGWYTSLNRYASVIVDEAQDFGAPEYRFLAAFTGNSYDNPVPYSLFICGDGHQRVYGRSGSLKECGINVHSRSRTLKVCYRSTQMIREYAENILSGVETKDMNGDSERLTDVSSLEKGIEPEEKFFSNGDYKANYKAMSEFMGDALKRLHESGVRYSDMAVLLRNAGRFKGDERYLNGVAYSLQGSGIPAVVVSKKSPAPHADAVQVMTMHRSKGLQFHGVIVDLTHWPYRDKNALDDEQRKSILDQEKQLLYIAVMRATSRVFITGVKGRPWELPRRQPSVARKTVADVARPQDREIASPIKPDNTPAKPNKVSVYHDFRRWLHANGDDAAKKALLSYEQDALRLYNAKKDKDKVTEIITQHSCSKSEELLAPWWLQFCKQNSCSKKLIDVIHECISEFGECFVSTRVDDVKSQKQIPLPVQFKNCPICGMKIKSSRLKRHLKRMHSQNYLVTDNLRTKTQREENYRTSHLTNAPDPEDVQRELYGDW